MPSHQTVFTAPNEREALRLAAFAFAGNDLLIETDMDGAMVYSAGNARRLLGADLPDLADSLVELAVPEDRVTLSEAFYRLTLHGRIDRVVVRLGHASGNPVHIRLSGINLPNCPGRLHFALALVPPRLPPALAARGVTTLPDYLEPEDFLAMTELRMMEAACIGETLSVTMLEVAAPDAGNHARGELDRGIKGMLRAWGGDPSAVGGLGENRYAVLHRHRDAPTLWEERVHVTATQVAPTAQVDCLAHTHHLDPADPAAALKETRGLLQGFARLGRRALARIAGQGPNTDQDRITDRKDPDQDDDRYTGRDWW